MRLVFGRAGRARRQGAAASWQAWLKTVMREPQLIYSLLVKIGVVAALASFLVRSDAFKATLMREQRTLNQRLMLAVALSLVFGLGVATRVLTHRYEAVDLGLEASLLSGVVGGYVCGLTAGALISLPAMFGGEYFSLLLFVGIGALGGLLRDCAPDHEEVWRFSPFLDLSLYRLFKPRHDHRRSAFQLFFLLAVLSAEFLRISLGRLFDTRYVFFLYPATPHPHPLQIVAIYVSTVFAVALPLKIWSATRNERKLEEQQRVLMQARLDALTSQINPHFLFNTLNSVASLIRTNPQQARAVISRLSRILRGLMRKHDNFTLLREELRFISDYVSIELVRFGDKLRFVTDVDPQAADRLVPSMMLQPLVENSIRHGLSRKLEGGVLRVASRLSGGRLHLVVEDDGIGMSEAKLAHLLDKGIGFTNVTERLKVLFGDDYRVRIDSRPGEGTRIEIEIPELTAPASEPAEQPEASSLSAAPR